MFKVKFKFYCILVAFKNNLKNIAMNKEEEYVGQFKRNFEKTDNGTVSMLH